MERNLVGRIYTNGKKMYSGCHLHREHDTLYISPIEY
jgi:hypothetical protein